jgi:hypothetical protein
MCFTPDCVETLGQYGYDVSSCVLTKDNRLDFLAGKAEIAALQRSLWATDFETPLKLQVRALYDALDR